ncbi:hypothetical protein FGG08_004513 [Glutinoglossum americanum]|uniref:Uncharacterized protein n=1 Tax=Glutinoglossum americanum TaxID=1670608 RepID=A0A9P8L2N4_9PEZI|nr:hypothetical protein FGG08_004513 [Glutinoglossum americanum]
MARLRERGRDKATGSRSTSTKRPKQHAPKRPKQHAPGSLRHMILMHNRCRLYVHPLTWTAQHLSLLRISVSYRGDVIPGRRVPSYALTDPLKMVHRLMSLIYDGRRIRLKFGRSYNTHPSISARLSFLFGRRCVAHVEPSISIIDRASTAPLFSYVDHSHRRDDRLKYFRSRAQGVREKLIRESTGQSDIDPYDASILIAMAQEMLRLTPGSSSEASLRPYLLARAPDEQSYHFYSASIPRAYLHSFDEPYEEFTSEIRISRSVYPLDLEGFPEVLGKILGLAPADPPGAVAQVPRFRWEDSCSCAIPHIVHSEGKVNGMGLGKRGIANPHDLGRPVKRQKFGMTPPNTQNTGAVGNAEEGSTTPAPLDINTQVCGSGRRQGE